MSLGSDSTTSLSQRDLSQEDETSTTSGQSSVDLHPTVVDDSERLAMLTSAVNWIKGELVSKCTSLSVILWSWGCVCDTGASLVL